MSLTPSTGNRLAISVESSQSLFEEFRAHWRDERIDVNSFVALHPEVADDPELLLDLIYDEWLLRCEAGEQITLNEFAERYPGFESSLCKLAAAEEAFSLRPDLLDEPTAWPADGDQLLGFRLLRLIGKGSFSRVYLAEELSVGRKVVLKVTKEDFREAQLLGRLNHPNIAKILSADDDPITGCNVVCMPYLGETTLSRILHDAYSSANAPRLAKQLLPNDAECEESLASQKPARVFHNGKFVDGALHFMLQLSDAVGSAHAKNIQHRDIKPTNVLVTPSGDVQLLDFNLSVDEAKIDQRLGGTLPYMSPEQLHAFVNRNGKCRNAGNSDDIGKKSDVYSLGVLFYELLTGGHPSGPFPEQLRTNQFCEQLGAGLQNAPIPVCEINPEVSAKLSGVIEKCLAVDPNNRFADANELHAALKSATTPVRRAGKWMLAHARKWAAGVAAAVWILVMCVWSWARQPDIATKHWNRAVDQASHRRWNEANTNLSAAMQHGVRNPKAYYLRGRVQMLRGEWQSAIANLQNALPLEDGRVHACLAYCYTVSKTPNFAYAETYNRSAIQLGFANAAIYNNLAYCCMKRKGKRRYAAPDNMPNPGDFLRLAIELEPASPTPYYNLALWERNISTFLPQYNPSDGVRAIQRFINLSKPNARVWREVARLYACAVTYSRNMRDNRTANRWRVKMDEAIVKAIEFGFPPSALEHDALLVYANTGTLQKNVAHQRRPVANEYNSAAFPAPMQIIDPLSGRIE